MSTFRISSTTQTMDVNAQGQGTVSITVSNASGANLRGRASIKTDDGVSPDAFTIAPPTEREFPVEGTEEFAVSFQRPKGAAAGDHKFKMRMVDPRLPDELGNDGDWIGYKLAEEKQKPFPWLWLIIPAAVLVLAAGGGAAWYFLAGPGHHTTPVTTVADVKVGPKDSTDFGTVQVNSSSPASVVHLHNSGSKRANVTSATAGTNAADFKIVADTCQGVPLEPGADCEVHVAFAPKSQGDKTAQLAFTVDSGKNPAAVVLTGSAQGVSALCFSAQPLSIQIRYAAGSPNPPTSSAAVTETVTNCGTASLFVQGASLSGDSFSLTKFQITNNQCVNRTLQPSETCTVSVQLINATYDSHWTVTLNVLDNGPGSPHQVPVDGVRAAYFCKINYCPVRTIQPLTGS